MVDAEKENFEAERSGDPARKARARELLKVALEQQKKAHDRKSAGGASTPPLYAAKKLRIDRWCLAKAQQKIWCLNDASKGYNRVEGNWRVSRNRRVGSVLT